MAPGPSMFTVLPLSLITSHSKPLPSVPTAGTVMVMAAVATKRFPLSAATSVKLVAAIVSGIIPMLLPSASCPTPKKALRTSPQEPLSPPGAGSRAICRNSTARPVIVQTAAGEKKSPAVKQGRGLVVLGKHQRAHASCYVGISGVFRSAIHFLIVVVTLPKEPAIAVLEAEEIMLSVRIMMG